MNSINIIGRLGRDPQINAVGTMASFSIAVQRQFKNKQTNEYESDWFNCKVFGKTAELIQKHFFKGFQIAFTGHLQNNNFEKENGTKVYRDEIIVDSITFSVQNNDARDDLDNSQTNTQSSISNQNYARNQSQTASQDPFESQGQPIDITDDDLPF